MGAPDADWSARTQCPRPPARGAGAGVNEVEAIPPPPRLAPPPCGARPPSAPSPASACPPAAVLDPDAWLPWAGTLRRGLAMAKRSSLSIRIVEGKNLPAKDM